MAHGVKLIFDGEERDVLFFSMDYFQPNRLDPVTMSAADLHFYKNSGVVPKDYVQPMFVTPYDYNRDLPFTSPPEGVPLGGLFRLTMESTDDDEVFYHSLKTTRIVHGVLEFYNGNEANLPFRRIEFWDSFVSELSETMSSHSGMPMLLHCVISPATVRVNKNVVVRKNWWITDIEKKEEPVGKMEKDIVFIEWIDIDTKKERKQTLSDKWVSLKMDTKNFKEGDEIKIKTTEINGKILEKGKTEIKITEKKGKNDTLTINKAFRFNKGKNNVNREVKVTVYWDDKNKSGKNTLKENNGGIWGTKDADAIKAMNDIKQVFSAPRFAAFNALIMIDKQDNNHISNINENDLFSILQNNLLNGDDKLAIEIVANTINSTYVHKVRFAKAQDNISAEELIVFPVIPQVKAYYERLATTIKWHIYSERGAVTQTTDYGSLSVIIEDAPRPDDYYDSVEKSYVKIPSSVVNYITTLHEIIGHGRSLTLGRTGNVNNDDAIYFENLLLRVMGYNAQRDGTKHADGYIIRNPSKNPDFK